MLYPLHALHTGTSVTIAINSHHHNPRIWPDPKVGGMFLYTLDTKSVHNNKIVAITDVVSSVVVS